MREDFAYEEVEIYRTPGRLGPGQAEKGIAAGEIYRKLYIGEQSYDPWHKKYREYFNLTKVQHFVKLRIPMEQINHSCDFSFPM